MNMKKFNSKGFFFKSAVIHFFISIFVIALSWQFLEPNAYNFMHKNFTAKNTGSDEIVLIVIDDKSIEQYRWPWKRELYGKIFEYINTYSNPKIIGFDALITSPDRENPQSDRQFFNSITCMD